MKILGRKLRPRRRSDFRLGFHHDGEQGNAILFNVDIGSSIKGRFSKCAANLELAELRLFGDVPTRVPAAVGRKHGRALSKSAFAGTFSHHPAHVATGRDGEFAIRTRAHHSLELHGLAGPIEISIGNDPGLRISKRARRRFTRIIRARIGDLQGRARRGLGDI